MRDVSVFLIPRGLAPFFWFISAECSFISMAITIYFYYSSAQFFPLPSGEWLRTSEERKFSSVFLLDLPRSQACSTQDHISQAETCSCNSIAKWVLDVGPFSPKSREKLDGSLYTSFFHLQSYSQWHNLFLHFK